MRLTRFMRKHLPWLLLALAVGATGGVYWPGVTGGWVFDDYPNIADNAAVHLTWGHTTFTAWVNAAMSSPSSFLHRPLASITFALNWMMGNGSPYPFKVTNIVIHVVNGVLLFCMLRALLRLPGRRRASDSGTTSARGRVPDRATGHPGPPQRVEPGAGMGLDANPQTDSGFRPAAGPGMTSAGTGIDEAAATRLALVVSAAWMLLPINLMAVLYVVQRMESLCQVFVLAGLWAYLHGRWMMLTAREGSRERRGLVIATCGIVFGTLLGLTAKETAVLLPVFAFLVEWIVLRFERPSCGLVQASPHSSLVRPGRPTGDSAEAMSVMAGNPHATDTRQEEEPEDQTESGSPLRGPRNDDATTAPGPHRTAVHSEPLASDLEAPAATDAKPVVSDPEALAATDAKPVVSDPDPYTPSHATRPIIPGRLAGPNPESVSRPTDHATSRRDNRLWALFTLTLFVPGILGFAWLLRGALNPASWAGRDFTLMQRLLTEARVLVDYLQWTLFPNPEVLSLYHDEIVRSTGLLAPWTTLGSMLLLAALIVVALLLRKRWPLVALGIGWFFAAQLLTATIIPLELVYEQRMYFGSIGVLLAVGALLLGVRWRIRWPLLRGTIVAIALLLFGAATTLRAIEWSNPTHLAVAEADRHPESARAVYEAGRLLLIASRYQPGYMLDESRKYLREAAAIPGSSALSDQALIMIADHQRRGDDAEYWASMTRKLREQPVRQEDISALISLTNCYNAGICLFDPANLQRAYEAALSRPHPIARLNGAYADFQRDVLHDDALAIEYLARAVAAEPNEPAYRVDLAALYARTGQVVHAREQIDALRKLNYAGRLDKQIAFLEGLLPPATPSAELSQ